MSLAYCKPVLLPSSPPPLLPPSYLSEGVGYLQSCLKKEREKAAAFRAMGLMVYVLKDRMDLEPVLATVKSSLPTGKEVPSK